MHEAETGESAAFRFLVADPELENWGSICGALNSRLRLTLADELEEAPERAGLEELFFFDTVRFSSAGVLVGIGIGVLDGRSPTGGRASLVVWLWEALAA